MKELGVVRKIDELGRVTLPKELRKVFNIKTGTPLEIFVEGDCIVLQKYSLNNDRKVAINEIIDCLSNATGLTALFLNLDKVVCAKGKGAEMFKDITVNDDVYRKLDERQPFACGTEILVENGNSLAYVHPLIDRGDLIGGIAVIADRDFSASDIKLTSMACDLFIKQAV